MADVEFGNDMKFEIYSQYDQVFAQFLKAEAADFFTFSSQILYFLAERLYVY